MKLKKNFKAVCEKKKLLFYRTHVDGCSCRYNISIFIENTCFAHWKHLLIELYKTSGLVFFLYDDI